MTAGKPPHEPLDVTMADGGTAQAAMGVAMTDETSPHEALYGGMMGINTCIIPS